MKIIQQFFFTLNMLQDTKNASREKHLTQLGQSLTMPKEFFSTDNEEERRELRDRQVENRV